MTETLRAHGVAYLDQPSVLVWVKGERLQHHVTTGCETGRAFRPGGLKVAFALLCHPEWASAPYGDVAPLSLIYADLLLIGDARCIETADLIYERILDGFVG